MPSDVYNLYKVSILTFISLGLCACGGRAAQPVSSVGQFDSQLSCAHLKGEFENNEKRLVELVGERGERSRDNLGMLLISPLFLDLSDTQKTEASAIDIRQEKLLEILKVRSCELPVIAVDSAKEAPASSG